MALGHPAACCLLYHKSAREAQTSLYEDAFWWLGAFRVTPRALLAASPHEASQKAHVNRSLVVQLLNHYIDRSPSALRRRSSAAEERIKAALDREKGLEWEGRRRAEFSARKARKFNPSPPPWPYPEHMSENDLLARLDPHTWLFNPHDQSPIRCLGRARLLNSALRQLGRVHGTEDSSEDEQEDGLNSALRQLGRVHGTEDSSEGQQEDGPLPDVTMPGHTPGAGVMHTPPNASPGTPAAAPGPAFPEAQDPPATAPPGARGHEAPGENEWKRTGRSRTAAAYCLLLTTIHI